MNTDLYRVFYITAIEKNFSKAAKRLFITQPSVSHSIKQLENELESSFSPERPREFCLQRRVRYYLIISNKRLI